jgi:hypothetical protein
MADVKQRDQIKPQTAEGASPADSFQQDLNPNTMAGQNIGATGRHAEKRSRTAKDVKPVHARFQDWSDADLAQVPILPAGARLEQNATYLNLAAVNPTEITATGGMTASEGDLYVAKSDVPYQLWNRLLGIRDVVRTGVAE